MSEIILDAEPIFTFTILPPNEKRISQGSGMIVAQSTKDAETIYNNLCNVTACSLLGMQSCNKMGVGIRLAGVLKSGRPLQLKAFEGFVPYKAACLKATVRKQA